MTGREALYDASIVDGRVSATLAGPLTPDDALQRLLTGTGLYVRFVAENAFVLLPIPADARSPAMPPASHRRYFGLIQDSFLGALCRSGGARPGRYRVVLVFRIGATGLVSTLQRIGSTGSADVDQRIEATLRQVRLNEAPPEDLAQPVSILLVPQAPGMTLGCDGADKGQPSVGATP